MGPLGKKVIALDPELGPLSYLVCSSNGEVRERPVLHKRSDEDGECGGHALARASKPVAVSTISTMLSASDLHRFV